MLLFLTGIGPLLAWRRTSLDSLKRNFGGPLLGGVVAGAIAWPLGCKDLFSLACVILSVFVTLTILLEFYRGAKVIRSRGGGNLFTSAIELALRNTRRYGGYVVHFGIVLVFIGISGQAFNQDKQMEMAPGSQMQIGQYALMCQAIDSIPNANYTSERISIEVMRDGRETMMLYPEKRNYGDSEESGTMVAISSTPREDLYVVYAGTSPQSGKPVIHAYLNPLVKWVWFGGLVVVLGTILALIPNRAPVMVMQAATQPAEGTARATGTHAIPATVHSEG